MNLKKINKKIISLFMGLTMCFSGVVTAQAGQSAPVETLPYSGITISSGHGNAYGIAKGNDGKLYVTEYGGNKIVEMDMNGGNKEAVVSSGISQPIGITVDISGNIYFAEHQGEKVSKLAGSTLSPVNSDSSLGYLCGIAIDSNGKIFFVDYNNGIIYKMNADGSNLTPFATGFSNISLIGMTVDEDDNLYVSDTHGKIIKIDSSGAVTNDFITGLSNPRGVAYGEDGYLYVFAGSKIIKYTTAGTKKTEFNMSQNPWSAYIDEGGYMYVCCYR